LPLEIEQGWVDSIKNTLPELPDQKKHRFMRDYGLSVYDSSVLIASRARADYYETVAAGRDPKLAANWALNELLGLLNKENRAISESPVTASQLGQLIDRIADDTISGKIAKDVFAEMYATGNDADKIIDAKGLKQVTDMGAIEKIVDEVIAENPDNVAGYRGGKEKLFGFFVGQVMKKSQGKANPAIINDLLKKKLEG